MNKKAELILVLEGIQHRASVIKALVEGTDELLSFDKITKDIYKAQTLLENVCIIVTQPK